MRSRVRHSAEDLSTLLSHYRVSLGSSSILVVFASGLRGKLKEIPLFSLNAVLMEACSFSEGELRGDRHRSASKPNVFGNSIKKAPPVSGAILFLADG